MSNTQDLSAYLPFCTNSNDVLFRFWLNKPGQWGWGNSHIEGSSKFEYQHLVYSSHEPGAFVAEQWTGEHDVQGKMIFEGDLMVSQPLAQSFGFEKDRVFMVVRKLHKWEAVCVLPKTLVHEAMPSYWTLHDEPGYAKHKWRIVGNIHEGITVKQA